MHTSPIGRVYIGITCRVVARRWGHNGVGYKNHPYFWKAIQKYGWDNFKHEILLIGLTKDEASRKEKEYIALYRSNNKSFGYNLTSGGEAGYELSQDAVQRQSDGLKRKWMDLEYREKVIRSCGNKGCHWRLSEETKEKMRKPKSEETKAKMRKPKSDETKKRMSEAKRKYFDSMTPEQRKQVFGTRGQRK